MWQSPLSFLCFLSSPLLSFFLFFFVFSGSRNTSWTYSCEYFRYPTVPSLTGIWREPPEPGVAPTSPDNCPSTQAKSLTRVSIYISTHSLWGCVGLGCHKLLLYVYTQSYGLCITRLYAGILDLSSLWADLCIYYTQGACKAISLYIIHMSWISAGSCTQKIQMFCFGSCVPF